MRIPRLAGLLALAALAFWLGRGSTDLAAQGLLTDGVFARDSGGTVWLITGGQRAQVPFMPATDEAIYAVPDSGAWVIQGEGGSLALGAQPSYVSAPPAVPQSVMASQPTATPTATPSADPPPSVSVRVNDSVIQAGGPVEIEVFAEDNSGIDWIEWEGTTEESDNGNDNRSTGDEALDGNHRYDCDGQTPCFNKWTVNPKTGGRFVIRARARDDEDNRSEWVTVNLRVQGSVATATPTRTP